MEFIDDLWVSLASKPETFKQKDKDCIDQICGASFCFQFFSFGTTFGS